MTTTARFLLKGGAYLELRLGLRSRATKDLDALVRGDFDEFAETLDAALAKPCGVIDLSTTAITRDILTGSRHMRFAQVSESVDGRRPICRLLSICSRVSAGP